MFNIQAFTSDLETPCNITIISLVDYCYYYYFTSVKRGIRLIESFKANLTLVKLKFHNKTKLIGNYNFFNICIGKRHIKLIICSEKNQFYIFIIIYSSLYYIPFIIILSF